MFRLLTCLVLFLLPMQAGAFSCPGPYDKEIMFIGDSISALPGSFPEQVAAEYPAGSVINLAVSGTSSVDWQPGSPTFANSGAGMIRARVVVILLGTNDAWPSVSTHPSQYRSNLEIIANVLLFNGSCSVMVVPPPRNWYLTSTDWKIMDDNLVAYAAEAKVYCTESGDRVVCGPNLINKLQPYHLVDRIHPNVLGHEVIKQLLMPRLEVGL